LIWEILIYFYTDFFNYCIFFLYIKYIINLDNKRAPSVKDKKTKIQIDSNKSTTERKEKKKGESNKNLLSKGQTAFTSSINAAFNANNYKTKSEFQKRLMSENNLIKYKTMCVSLLKDDEELKKLCEYCGYTPNVFDNLLEEFFFTDKVFLYKLEILLSSESNLNKLKKEKFFKEEIKSRLEFKSMDLQYEQRIQKINFAINNHIKNIQNFEFFK